MRKGWRMVTAPPKPSPKTIATFVLNEIPRKVDTDALTKEDWRLVYEILWFRDLLDPRWVRRTLEDLWRSHSRTQR